MTILGMKRDADSAVISCVCCLVQHLEASLRLAQTNVLSAAKHAPAHGNYRLIALMGWERVLVLHQLKHNIFIIISSFVSLHNLIPFSSGRSRSHPCHTITIYNFMSFVNPIDPTEFGNDVPVLPRAA